MTTLLLPMGKALARASRSRPRSQRWKDRRWRSANGSHRSRRSAPRQAHPTGDAGSLRSMAILLATHPAFELHDTGRSHPERPARLEAVAAGATASGLDTELVPFAPQPAPVAAIERVHPGRYLTALQEFTAAGGGYLDADTAASEESFEAALLAAGAGLD